MRIGEDSLTLFDFNNIVDDDEMTCFWRYAARFSRGVASVMIIENHTVMEVSCDDW